MNRLLEIGFELAGRWALEDGKLCFELTRNASQKNILYAFVCDGDVVYVGKTVQTLRARMGGYKNPGRSQVTNIRNSRLIRDALGRGSDVGILALPDDGLLHYGVFHLNLAAGLEDDIIRKLDPPWNGGRKEDVSVSARHVEDALMDLGAKPVSSFEVLVGKTYYDRGFFNAQVAVSTLFGADRDVIEIFLESDNLPIKGVINRRENPNGTPRIIVGAVLRKWFQERVGLHGVIRVDVLSPVSIRLNATSLPQPS